MSGIVTKNGPTSDEVIEAIQADPAGIREAADAATTETYVFEGDSWTAGTAQGNDRETWVYYFSRLASIRNRVDCYNVATAGQTAAAMVSTFATQVLPKLTAASGKPSTLFLFAGINDVSGTITQLRDNLRSMWTSARNAGAKVVAFTLPHRAEVNGWSQANWAAINAQIIADSSYYDYLVRTDIVFPNLSNGTLSPDGLHVVTGYHASFATRVLDSINGRSVMPAITPNLVCSSGNSVTFSAGTRRNLPFNNPSYDDGNDVSYQTIGSDASTMVFTAPTDGWYEIMARSCLGGLASGDQAQMSAWINNGSETELRLDYQYASGQYLTIGGINRRKLTRGNKVYISITTTKAGATWLAGPAFFNVRLLSIS